MGRPLLRWLPALVVAATVLYTISVYPTLPARMPTHWGINGQPNGWSTREFGAWLLPGMMVMLWFFLTVVVPRKDPRKTSSEKFATMFGVFTTAILTFQAVIQYVILSIAQGHAVDVNTVIYVAVGALFAVLGLAVPRKAGGFLLATAGVLTMVAGLTAPPVVAFATLVVSSVAASVGSLLISLYWRQR